MLKLYEPFNNQGDAVTMREDAGGHWVHIDDYTECLRLLVMSRYRIAKVRELLFPVPTDTQDNE